MAELDNEIEEEVFDDTQDESQDDSNIDITYEQALEWKKKAERLDKAEKALVERKRAEKEAKKQEEIESTDNPRQTVKEIMAEERFFEQNPEAEWYRDAIDGLKKKWLSLEDAYYIASKKDREIDNTREVYGKSIVQGNQISGDSVKLISVSDYDKMSEKEQDSYNDVTSKKFWGVRFK